jgi:hypothetical protein
MTETRCFCGARPFTSVDGVWMCSLHATQTYEAKAKAIEAAPARLTEALAEIDQLKRELAGRDAEIERLRKGPASIILYHDRDKGACEAHAYGDRTKARVAFRKACQAGSDRNVHVQIDGIDSWVYHDATGFERHTAD